MNITSVSNGFTIFAKKRKILCSYGFTIILTEKDAQNGDV